MQQSTEQEALSLETLALDIEDAVAEALGHGPVAPLILERRRTVEVARTLRERLADLRTRRPSTGGR